jgi:hypothetical protein
VIESIERIRSLVAGWFTSPPPEGKPKNPQVSGRTWRADVTRTEVKSRDHLVPAEETLPDPGILYDPSDVMNQGYNPYESWALWQEKCSNDED